MDQKVAATLIILDDDRDVLLSARLYLEQYFERIISLQNPAELMPQVLKNEADLVLLDMNYHRGENDGHEGLQLLKQIKKSTDCEVLVMTAYGEIELAVDAIKAGAFDFIIKPWSNEKLRTTLMAALKFLRSQQELNRLKKIRSEWNTTIAEPVLLGESEAIQNIRALIERAAPTEANILILGENGTGKEIVAQMIHQNSPRKASPLVKVDLGAIHENLFESELFGAKKGAYTDLKEDKQGRIALAEKGSLFLDEIGNLSRSNQAKMLEVLQNLMVTAVGDNRSKKIDVRIIAATNSNLQEMIEQSEFRQDLYYRLKTIELLIPPLRDRAEDVPLLANHFLKLFAKKYRKQHLRIGAKTMDHLMNYDWPGNVRELEHAIERAVILANADELSAQDIVLSEQSNFAAKAQMNMTLDEVERRHISSALETYKGNISKTAAALGLTRAALYRRIEKYSL